MHAVSLRTAFWLVLYLATLAAASLRAEPPISAADAAVIWNLERLDAIAGHKATIVGRPQVVSAGPHKAVAFGGAEDALFLELNPLSGLRQFTVEVIFRPAAGGPREQRFLHFQENGSENRLLFETRITNDNRWFLDTFLKSGDGNYTLYAERSLHEIGPWYHAAVVVDEALMRHYVNGIEELSMPIRLEPLLAGRTSIGARINQVSWFKGAVRQIRITPRALAPAQFWKP